MAEAIVVLALSLLVGATLCAVLIMQGRLARAVSERIAHNDALRMTFHVVPSELRFSDPIRDVRAASGDSIAGRWVRLAGAVCDVNGTAVWLRLRGMRAPDPAKDSVLVITADGETAFALTAATRDAAHCPAGADEQVYRTTSLAGAHGGAVVLVFESGTYYLSQRALRYRLGGEGRQPITEEFLVDAGSTLDLIHGDSVVPAHLRINVALKRAVQQSAGRLELLTTVLPNSPRGS